VADENFTEITVHTVGEHHPTHGFSSVVFIPDQENIAVALKSEEFGSQINSYLMVFDLNGTVLMDEVPVANAKYEGLEIL
jgi:soluble calcium-activated nucleotidase 1